MRFFAMDLHISVIADFKSSNPDIEVVDWCLSGHAAVMNRLQDYPKVINPKTWEKLNEAMIREFQSVYDSYLKTFDGFVVGHVPAFAMIYEKYNKPIVWINTCRYDLPFCFTNDMAMREKFHECLKRIQPRLAIVSNNKFDQAYTLAGTGMKPMYNPSLCLYTNTRYKPTTDKFLCYNSSTISHPLIHHKSQLAFPFQWSDITSFRGIVYFPYEMSTMSMFEHFTAGCPMFFPSKTFLKESCTLQTIQAYWKDRLPDTLRGVGDMDMWIENSDMYTVFQSSNTYYFDSFEHLYSLLETFTYVDDWQFREAHIRATKKKWKDIVKRLMFPNYFTGHLCYNKLPLLANQVYDIDYTYSGVKALHSYPPIRTLQKGDVVFVKTDCLDMFLDKTLIYVPITLVTGVSDLSPSEFASSKILSNPNIVEWIGCNINVSHPKIRKVLIGVGEAERENGNHDTLVRLHASRLQWEEKIDSLCIPYHSNTHKERTFEHMLPKLPFEDYMRELNRYKFVRCQRGNGLDTHRFCEILLMGSVPVVDHGPLDDLYSQFPCVFSDEDASSFVWNDGKYQAFLDMFWLRKPSIE